MATTAKPFVGPILTPNRPMVNVPVSASTQTANPINGTLQGPYPNRDASGNITSISQGKQVGQSAGPVKADGTPYVWEGTSGGGSGGGGSLTGDWADAYRAAAYGPQASQPLAYTPPAPTGLTFDQAKGQVSGQIDPMFARALEALQVQKRQDQLDGDQLGMARGGAHSGLAADLQNKVGIAASGKASDLDAQRQTQIAQMAQDLVKYGQDYDLRNKQAALAEYLGISGLDLQKQGQQADYTGILNGMQTMQSKNADRGYGLDLAGLSGQLPGSLGGGQTMQAKSLAFDQGMQNRQMTNQEQSTSFNQSMQTKQFDYQKVQDDIKNGQWTTQTENQMKQWAEGNKLNWAQFDQSTKQALAQIAISQQNANTSSFSAANSARNQANDNNLQREKFAWEKTQGTQNAALSKELDGLYTGITSGQITGSAAIDEINNKVKVGLIKPADAAQMLTLINSVNSSQPNVRPALSQQQIDANGGNNPQDLNSAQLDKLWGTDPTGKAAGRPSLDWAAWYTDPRGKVGGISYEAWKQAYGPQLKAR
jgi:hypothetical protein